MRLNPLKFVLLAVAIASALPVLAQKAEEIAAHLVVLVTEVHLLEGN